MRNIKRHKICIPHEIIDKCWPIYFDKYKKIENSLAKNKLKDPRLHDTGSFQLDTKVLEKIKNDPLLDYFISDKAERLTIQLKTKSLFRGLDYFVGLQPVDNHQRLKIIRTNLSEMMSIINKVSPASNVVLYLALIDYIRNYLLMILYAVNQTSRELGGNGNVQNNYEKLIQLLMTVEKSFVASWSENKISILNFPFDPIYCLNLLCDYLDKSMVTLKNNVDLCSNLFRKVRECNNPAKIMNFAQRIAEDYLASNTILIGLEYGGIELPFVVNAYRSYLGKNELQYLTVNMSSYSTNSSKSIDRLADSVSPFANRIAFKNNNVLLLDDSVTTGRTVERLINLLPMETEDVYLGVVSFTNTNRFHHLARLGHGGINPEVIKCTTCLYKSNFTQTYSKNSYTNKNGIFDSEKSKIIKLINKYECRV